MNFETYKAKRDELRAKYPRYMSPIWLFAARSLFIVLLLILVKVTQSTLPSYDIKCLHDNVLEGFHGLQKYFSSASVVFGMQLALLLAALAASVGTAVHWVANSESFRLPLVVLIFFLVKVFSDISLIVDRPHSVLWVDFSFLGFQMTSDRLLFANVCPITGIFLIAIFSFSSLQNDNLRRVVMTLLISALVFSLFVQFTFQLAHSFAIFSAMVIAGFAIVVSEFILDYIFHRKSEMIIAEELGRNQATEVEKRDMMPSVVA